MLHLHAIVTRNPDPEPWQEGDNIPWHEPEFSARMLAEHLTQAHDRASRRSDTIDRHVAWIHEFVLRGEPSTLLDLGCGPGLYANRLARLGHQCVGIDYSPASIAYAREQAAQSHLDVRYHLEDIRKADFGPAAGYDLVMLLFGEFNVFSRTDIGGILTKAHAALRPGGRLLLEPHTFAAIAADTPTRTSWFSSPGGLFDPAPHLVLMENFWDAARAVLTLRYYVVKAGDGSVTRHAQSLQAYSTDDYVNFLATHGFASAEILPGLAADRLTPDPDFCAILAAKVA